MRHDELHVGSSVEGRVHPERLGNSEMVERDEDNIEGKKNMSKPLEA